MTSSNLVHFLCINKNNVVEKYMLFNDYTAGTKICVNFLLVQDKMFILTQNINCKETYVLGYINTDFDALAKLLLPLAYVISIIKLIESSKRNYNYVFLMCLIDKKYFLFALQICFFLNTYIHMYTCFQKFDTYTFSIV